MVVVVNTHGPSFFSEDITRLISVNSDQQALYGSSSIHLLVNTGYSYLSHIYPARKGKIAVLSSSYPSSSFRSLHYSVGTYSNDSTYSTYSSDSDPSHPLALCQIRNRKHNGAQDPFLDRFRLVYRRNCLPFRFLTFFALYFLSTPFPNPVPILISSLISSSPKPLLQPPQKNLY